MSDEIGRPSDYTPELAAKICDRIATCSLGLRHIAAEFNTTHATIYNWLRDNKDFFDMYSRAKELQADFIAEEILDIADDGSNDLMTIVKGDQTYEQENKEVTSRSKLRVTARMWAAAKLRPRKYGDKIDLTTNGDNIGGAVAPEVLQALADKINS